MAFSNNNNMARTLCYYVDVSVRPIFAIKFEIVILERMKLIVVSCYGHSSDLQILNVTFCRNEELRRWSECRLN